MKFKIFGINISISFMFLAIIVYFIINDMYGMVPLILLSIFFHELMHIICIKLYGNKIYEIDFTITGIAVKTDWIFKNQLEELFVHLVAPIGNIFVYLICRLCNTNYMLAYLNLFMGIYNLLPIENFDGGNALEILFQIINVKNSKKIRAMITYTITALIILLEIYQIQNRKFNLTIFILIIILIKNIRLKH